MADLTAAGNSTCIMPEQRKRQEGSPLYLNFCTRLHKINMSAFCMTKSEPISLLGMLEQTDLVDLCTIYFTTWTFCVVTAEDGPFKVRGYPGS